MTVDQIFESNVARKVIWTKRGEDVTKRTVSTLSSLTPKTTIARNKNEGSK